MTHVTRAICILPYDVDDLIPKDRERDFVGGYANILSDDDLYILRQCREMLNILKDGVDEDTWEDARQTYVDTYGDQFNEDWI